ncbi:hypothetical protein A7E75_03065 [Syntrophotalea acetylenica]|jgi:hypothetical protein|uniref:Uncharacterized protein n=2 Tax=Syntrophotaleaceae TaxID=2812024 RepID=A0A1L3GE75_SYNAC|nr:hypothetical protein A7E75_03065 [Syntrophotalea acetylenica]APG44707.1 hypothetical protein A6070_11690 [Syntrophotalea acetylenica]
MGGPTMLPFILFSEVNTMKKCMTGLLLLTLLIALSTQAIADCGSDCASSCSAARGKGYEECMRSCLSGCIDYDPPQVPDVPEPTPVETDNQ